MANFDSHLEQGKNFLRLERIEEAIVELKSALALQPGNLRALEQLGMAHFHNGEFADAQTVYDSLVTDEPEKGDHWQNLGLVHLKLGDGKKALANFERSRLLGSDSQLLLKYEGFAFALLEQHQEAFLCFARSGDLAMKKEMALHLTPAQMEEAEYTLEGDKDDGSLEIEVDLETSPSAPSIARGAAIWNRTLKGLPPSLPLKTVLGPGAGIEQIEPGVVLCRTNPPVFVRKDWILATAGDVAFEDVKRRRRAQTSADFLGGNLPIVSVAGDGAVFLASNLGSNGEVVSAIDVDKEHIYFREEIVVAFDGGLRCENGKIPGQKIDVVQFRGKGRVAFCHPRGWTSIAVEEGESISVKASSILGWAQKLVPRTVSGDSSMIVCEGPGLVFVGGHFIGGDFFGSEVEGDLAGGLFAGLGSEPSGKQSG